MFPEISKETSFGKITITDYRHISIKPKPGQYQTVDVVVIFNEASLWNFYKFHRKIKFGLSCKMNKFEIYIFFDVNCVCLVLTSYLSNIL